MALDHEEEEEDDDDGDNVEAIEGPQTLLSNYPDPVSPVADLKRVSVPLKELLSLGFAAPVLIAAGFTPAELKPYGILVDNAAGFTPTQ